jgi:serine/threonine protein kinase/Tol biopolymer transport system component
VQVKSNTSELPSKLGIGDQLDQYEIIALLGAGGMGEVYRARDTRLGREVALKVLPRSFSADSERLRRFDQEARALASLNHPNILAVHDAGDGEHRYFVTELLDGETLRDRINFGPLGTRRSVEYGLQIVNGLAAAHGKGVVHRDLKPENVFITRAGQVKILDFGLARLSAFGAEAADSMATLGGSEVLTSAGVTLGTAGYMAPEQVRGLPADHRCDIFAFGAVLYEMLSGRRAFKHDTAAETMTAVLREDPPELAEGSAQIPPALGRIVRRCLEKDPEQRFQSARDLAFALTNLEASSSSKLAAQAESRSRFGKRTLWFAAVCAATVVGALSLAALAGLFSQPGPHPLRFTQLTNDSYSKNDAGWPPPMQAVPLATDGSRIFFTERPPDAIAQPAQVAVSGGEVIPFRVPFKNSQVMGSSPDHSEVILDSFVANEVEAPWWLAPTTGGSPERIDDVAAHDLSFARDNSALAYCSGDGLWIEKTSGGPRKRIFTAPAGAIVQWPRWSPDGRLLRFTVQNPMKWSSALWQVSADGKNPRMLLPGWNKPAIECCGDWTADGKYFVFQTSRANDSQIWAVSDGWLGVSAPFPITDGPLQFIAPLPAPDGKHLYVVGRQPRNELQRFDLASKQAVVVGSVPSVDFIDYSADGQWEAYTTSPEGVLWRSRVDGSDRLQLTRPPEVAAAPRWSPDGRRIAFTSVTVGQPPQIKVISTDGGVAEAIAPEARDEVGVTWSPDGRSIVFGRLPWLEVGYRSPVRLVRVDLETHRATELPGSENLFSPAWAPKGNLIAALYGDSVRPAVYDLASGKSQVLPETSASIPAWDRSSGEVLFGLPGHDLIRWNPFKAGGAPRAVSYPNMTAASVYWADAPVSAPFLTVMPDDSPAIIHFAGSAQIFSINWP